MIKNLIIIMVLLSSQIVAYEGDGVNLSCDTSQLYDPTETKITFYTGIAVSAKTPTGFQNLII